MKRLLSAVSRSEPGLSGLSSRLKLMLFFYAGPLPKVLPVSLEVLTFGVNYKNTNKFTGGIPSEWGALANLKKLKMASCGLDGRPLSIRAEHFILFVC